MNQHCQPVFTEGLCGAEALVFPFLESEFTRNASFLGVTDRSLHISLHPVTTI